MKYKENWSESAVRFTKWWNGEKTDRPLLWIVAKKEHFDEEPEKITPASNEIEFHLDVDRKVKEMRNMCKTHTFYGDAYPYMSVDIGPGSMATYLGSEPIFKWDTVWYTECIKNWNDWPDFKFDNNNYWWNKHYSLVKKARELSNDDFFIAITDIVEGIDIIANMRGPQNLCYDLIDNPDVIHSRIKQLDNVYFEYYDRMYDVVKQEDNSSCYMCFSIWGPGKTAKIQCDFSALMSPDQFREFAVPSIRKQCQRLDNVLYHLDGVDALRHVDELFKIKDIKAIQWTAGAGKPDGGSEQWYDLYEKVRSAGKALWISIGSGCIDEWIAKADNIIRTFGNQGLYFLFPVMSDKDAKKLLLKAEDSWTY